MSYTRFEMSGLVVKENFMAASDTVQATNEKFEGATGLYDVLVNFNQCTGVLGADANIVCCENQRDKHRPDCRSGSCTARKAPNGGKAGAKRNSI